MADPATLFSSAITIGSVATLVMDVGGVLRARATGVPSLDYALVGRWVASCFRGQLRHRTILQSDPMMGEAALGWIVHYAIGIGFAAGLVLIAGPEPTLAASLGMGIATSAAPLLIMQPAFGFGIAGSRLPRPWIARMATIATHLIFGLGLFAGGRVWAWLV